MTTPCYYLNFLIRGYDAEVFMNGAPITNAVRAYQCVTAIPVSEWLVQGDNTISVTVHGGTLTDPHVEEAERRARALAGDEEPETEGADGGGDDIVPAEVSELDAPVLRVALCEGIVGEIVDPGAEKELFALEWTPPPVPTSEDEAPLPLPHTIEETGAVSHPWGTWAWEGAPAFDLDADPGVVIDVLDFLRTLHDALGQNNVSALVNAGPLSYDEVAPCYDFDPADARSRLAQAWPRITAPDDFALAEFDETDLELRSCCGGRVLEPRSFSGAPFLRQSQAIDGVRWMLPIYLAKIDGQLQIVR